MNELKVYCPLVDRSIDAVDCMENREVREEFIPEEFKKKKIWKDICRKCKYYND